MQVRLGWGLGREKEGGGEGGRKYRKTFKAVRKHSPLWRNFDFEVYSSINI